MHMWNMNSIEREPPHNDRSSLTCIKIAPDEKGAGCGTEDGILAFWDLDVCQCLWTVSSDFCFCEGPFFGNFRLHSRKPAR